MKSLTSLCIIIYAFACIQTGVHTFTTTQNCIDDNINILKDKRSDLSREYFLSDQLTNESLRRMCEYYVPHKVHKVLKLVDRATCKTEISSSDELDKTIYTAYEGLLNTLKIYEGRDIPNSFGRHNDHITTTTNAMFDMTRDRLAGICLHTDADKIE